MIEALSRRDGRGREGPCRRDDGLLRYFWWICFTIGFALAAAALPTDGSYDFKNYHLYNEFAAFHDRQALDIAPAQLQTGYFYGLDAVYYLLLHH